MDYAAKYGIWGQPTHGLNKYQVAAEQAGKVQGLFGQFYDNVDKKQKADASALANQETRATMNDKILATNTKNQTDAKYYPQEQEAKIKQLAASLGLTYAQTKHAIAQANESNALAKLHGANTGLVQGLTGQWVADPRTGTKNSGAGKTYTNPETGQVVSSNTTAQTSRDQKGIAGIQNAEQYINEAIDKVPQFQTMPSKLKLGSESIMNMLGVGNYPGPSDYQTGQAAIKSSAEGLINSFSLNATGENVNKMIDILTLKPGESTEYGRKRMEKEASNLLEQEYRMQSRLRQGTDVTAKGGLGRDDVQSLADEAGIPYEEALQRLSS